MRTKSWWIASGIALLAPLAAAQPAAPATTAAPADGPYKVVDKAKVGGEGGFDYVYADVDGRKLYVPRSGQGAHVSVFDLDTLKPVGEIANAAARGAAVDPKSGHGFCSSSPVVMWDTATLKPIKTIEIQGRPDGILFEPLTEKVYVLSHSAPNVTVIDANDGSVMGTIDLGGAPEQGQSDGAGHVYIDLEDKDKIAVVDAKTMKKTGEFDLQGKGGGPAGLGLDIKNKILFAFCADPATCVVMSAEDGKILATLPIGQGIDGGGFNANTMEAFSSQGDGTLTIIKEKSPTSFEVEQNVQTMRGAKTCTLDSKTNRILLIAAEYGAPPAPAPQAAAPSTSGGQAQAGRRGGGRRGGRAPMVAGSFTIVSVAK